MSLHLYINSFEFTAYVFCTSDAFGECELFFFFKGFMQKHELRRTKLLFTLTQCTQMELVVMETRLRAGAAPRPQRECKNEFWGVRFLSLKHFMFFLLALIFV